MTRLETGLQTGLETGGLETRGLETKGLGQEGSGQGSCVAHPIPTTLRHSSGSNDDPAWRHAKGSDAYRKRRLPARFIDAPLGLEMPHGLNDWRNDKGGQNCVETRSKAGAACELAFIEGVTRSNAVTGRTMRYTSSCRRDDAHPCQDGRVAPMLRAIRHGSRCLFRRDGKDSCW